MATPTSVPVTLAERTEIHKSCKSLESIVNTFNEYCRAADNLASTQKKLAKCLREAAVLKGTGELPANALNIVSGLFDTLADVDLRFVKVADKEYEGVTSDLKKWFKKLAKEEKGHDDKIAAANLKIKQAGQAYEKKAKRKDRDAAEEHIRYVNILSTVGPEMSQEKYNHTLFVTQRHTTVLYAVASSLSRMADAEWARSCECVRRFSPVIGQIGEYRSFLEGGWTGALPSDNPNIESTVPDHEDAAKQVSVGKVPQEMDTGTLGLNSKTITSESPSRTESRPINAFASRHSSSSGASLHNPLSAPGAFSPPVMPWLPSTQERGDEQDKSQSIRSLESLSSFPTPPNHFPIPALSAVGTASSAVTAVETGASLQPPNASSSDANNSYTSRHVLSESPTSDSRPETTPALTEDSKSPMSSYDEPSTPSTNTAANLKDDHKLALSNKDLIRGTPGELVSESARPLSPRGRKISVIERGEKIFRSDITQARARPDLKEKEAVSPQAVERRDSIASISSRVAAVRDRWGRDAGPASPPPRDIPRLPYSVSDLASRYTPLDYAQTSPGRGVANFPTDQNRPPADSDQRRRPDSRRQDHRSVSATNMGNSTPTSTPALAPHPASSPIVNSPMEDVGHRQRIEGPGDTELRQQESEFKEREREIVLRVYELERDRARLLGSRPETDEYPKNTSRNLSTGQLPAGHERLSPATARPHSQYSYSTNNLLSTPLSAGKRPTSQYNEPNSPLEKARPTDHAPFCGCHACSVAQYSSSTARPASNTHDSRPPQPPIVLRPEKPKNWIRRLSMPVIVGNAFSIDSKKSFSSSPVMATNSLGMLGRDGGNSTTNPKTNNPTEDGRILRKGFEQDASGGISNVQVRSRKLSFGRR